MRGILTEMGKTELMDIVNGADRVVGKASREDVYRKLLPHRIVHVLVFNSKGHMALQKRSGNVSFCPNCWSTAVGGHVQAGENYHEAALREYEEELGIKTPLTLLSKDYYRDKRRLGKFVATFSAMSEGPFNLDKKSVESVKFFSMRQIQRMVSKGEKFHPELLFILKKHFGILME